MGIDRLALVCPGWKPIEMIGEGSLAKVYKAENTDTGETCAVKVISLPQNTAELEGLKADGMDDISIKAYYSEMIEEIMTEIELTQSLKESSNVVNIYDCKVVEKEETFGWDIYIRMELLVPFENYTALYPLTEADSVKLAIDICTALELCEEKGIIHRDIKPESIMLSLDGTFKLSDFTVTRDDGKTGSILSSKGGFVYLAPEIAGGGEYDQSADVYSLGLLMYKLNNNNCMPFIDPNAENVSYEEKKEAVSRRLSGEALPMPCNASHELAQVILAACAFDPAKRFRSASALKMVLNKIAPMIGIPIIAVDYQTMVGAGSRPLTSPETPGGFESDIFEIDDDPVVDFDVDNSDNYEPELKNKKKKKNPLPKEKKRLIIILSCAGAAVIIIALLLVFLLSGSGSSEHSTEAANAIIAALKEDQFDKASQLYDDYGGNMEELRDKLKERLNDIYSEFLAVKGAYDDAYDSAIAEIEAIDGFGDKVIDEKISETQRKVEALYTSRRSFDQGLAFLTNKQYAEAIEAYNKVVKDDPNYEEAQKRRKEAIEPYRAQITEDAQFCADDGYRYEEAIEMLNTALELLPEDEVITEKLDSIREQCAQYAINEADTLIEAGDIKEANKILVDALAILEQNEALEEKLESLADEIISVSDAQVEKGEFDEAAKTLNDALEYLVDNPKIQDAIKDLDTKMENYYIKETDLLVSDKKYEAAVDMLEEAHDKLPESENIKKKQAELEEKIVSAADELIKAAEFDDAEKLLNKAIGQLVENKKLTEKLENLTTEIENYYLEKADKLLAQNDLEGAIDAVSEGLKSLSDSKVLKEKSDNINHLRENAFIEDAEAAMSNYDYYEAIDILKNAQSVLPDSDVIENKLSELKNNAPEDLDDITCTDYENVSYYSDTVKDEKGNSYSKYVSFSTKGSAYAVYDLGGDYSTFAATVFTTNSNEKSVRIYLDNSTTPVYSKDNIDDDTKPEKIVIDISGARSMRIEVEVDALFVSKSVFFGEPMLY